MRQIIPYSTAEGAIQALDNGGRFFNLFARINDEVVSPSELSRAAGVYSPGVSAFLHFEMALMGLSREDKGKVLSLLSSKLKSRYQRERPWVLKPSEVESIGRAGNAIITRGYPALVQDKARLRKLVIMVSPGRFLPILQQYDVYELWDSPDTSDPCVAVAVMQGAQKLPNSSPIRVGGVLKELRLEPHDEKEHNVYLEALYYSPAA